MSDKEGIGTKRTYSKVDTPSDANADDERRNLIREEMAKPSDDVTLVDTQWLNQFFSGEDAPVLLAKGDAASTVTSDAFKYLSEWYGVRSDALALRVMNIERNKPAEVLVLESSKKLSDALDIPTSYWFYGATVYSAFPDRKSLDNTEHPLDPATTVGELDLDKSEIVVVENPEKRPIGRTGLGNMGNSCFMNSSLQCLLHIPELAMYFLSEDYVSDLNRENPIGCRGEVAEAFAELARQSYTERGSSFRPTQFRFAIGRFNRSFVNRMQQDSQEFTVFLLDSLHEDLNRVSEKPATSEPELGENEKPTEEAVKRLAHESWETHKKRNDSRIMDLFTGMYKSTLICPVCDKVSLRFDPFFDLTLPLPSSTYWLHTVEYVPWDAQHTPVKLDVVLSPADSVFALKQQVAKIMGSTAEKLIAGDVFQKKIYRILADSNSVADTIESSDVIVVYETSPLESRPDEQGEMTPMTPASSGEGEQPVPVPVYVLSPSYPGHPFFVCITESMSADEIKLQVNAKLEQLVGVCPGSKIKVFEGSIEDLVYTVDERRTWSLDELNRQPDDEGTQQLSPTAPRTPPSEEDEPFETVSEIRPSEETNEHVRSPVHSPSSSSISPLSDTGSPPAVNDQDVMRDDEPTPPRERQLNPRRTVLVVEVESDDGFDEASPAFKLVENAAATQAKSVLEAHKTTTLEDCLDRFAQPEILGQNDLWYCPRCKEFRQAQKQIELWRVPDVLMIHLKRFSGSMTVSKKINDLVTFPLESFDLSRHLSEAAQHINDGLIYDLIAVDNHYGGMGGGHYTAYVWDSFAKEWLDFNDSFVEVMEPSKVVSPAAYLLFYKRRGANTTAQESVREAIANLRAKEKAAAAASAAAKIAESTPAVSSSPTTDVVHLSGELSSPSPPTPQSESSPTTQVGAPNFGAPSADAPSSDVFVGEGHRLGNSPNTEGSAQLPWSS